MADTSNLMPAKTYSIFVGFAFTVNYIIGVGVLSLPYAFYHAGIGLALILMFLVSVISYVTMLWLIECLSRMEVYAEYERSAKATVNSRMSRSESEDSDGRPLLDGQENGSGGGGVLEGIVNSYTNGYGEEGPKLRITYRKYEINEMIFSFLGRPYARAYDVILFLYIYGSLWGFSSMWGTTMTDTIPFIGITDNVTCDSYGDNAQEMMVIGEPCMTAYQLYVVFFALIVIPLSLLDLSEQVIVQMALCVFRFYCFFAMLAIVSAAVMIKPFGEDSSFSSSESPPYWADDLKMFNLEGFGLAFSACVFSQLAQYSLPSIIQPIRDKSKLREMLLAVLTSTWIFYSIISSLIAAYFGEGTKEMISLNWSWPEDLPDEGTQWYEYLLRYSIIFFPVALSVSAFPLTAVALGNSIYTALPDKWTNNQSSRPMKYGCRLFAGIPPIFLGLFLYDLAVIVQITGALGVFIAFFFPAYLQYASQKRMKEIYGASLPTPYSGFYSHPYIALSTVFLSLGIFALSVALIILDVLDSD